jgi:hypothetical protein
MTDNKVKVVSAPSLIEQYQRAFSEHGDTPAGVMWPRGRQALRFDALTRHFSDDGFSILDYGCGLSHLKEYLDQRFKRYEYLGADLVPEFVRAATTKYPDARVVLVRSHADVSEQVDHVVISGTFNIIDGVDRAVYIDRIQSALLHLFSLARISLSVNFMTDRVDFVQSHALHMNVEEMMDFTRRKLSPRLRVDESYMPYEFTLVVIKDCEVVRPENIYKPS